MSLLELQTVEGNRLLVDVTHERDGRTRMRIVTDDSWCDAGEHVALLDAAQTRELARVLARAAGGCKLLRTSRKRPRKVQWPCPPVSPSAQHRLLGKKSTG